MWGGTPFPLRSFSNRPLFQQPPSLYNHPPLFVIPSEAEGSAVQRTILGNVFRQGPPLLFQWASFFAGSDDLDMPLPSRMVIS
jgi:hypothetical protein